MYVVNNHIVHFLTLSFVFGYLSYINTFPASKATPKHAIPVANAAPEAPLGFGRV